MDIIEKVWVVFGLGDRPKVWVEPTSPDDFLERDVTVVEYSNPVVVDGDAA